MFSSSDFVAYVRSVTSWRIASCRARWYTRVAQPHRGGYGNQAPTTSTRTLMARRLAGRDDDGRDLLSGGGVLVSKATGRATARGDRAADPLLRAPAPARGGSPARRRVRRRADPHAARRVAAARGRERGGGEHAPRVDGPLEQAALHVRLRPLLSPRLRHADCAPRATSVRRDPGEHDAGLPRVRDRGAEAPRQPRRRLHARAEP